MSDPDEKRRLREAKKEAAGMERALEQARASVRQHLQRGIEEIPVYTVSEDADEREFHKLLMQRRTRIFNVAPTTILGLPVTPPVLPSPAQLPEEKFTFHIVKLVGRIRTVLLLFRESDIYFVAFNPSGDPASTWFRFKDTPIPSFLTQIELPYNCRYDDLIFQGLVDDKVLLVPPSTSSLLSNPLIAPNIFNDLKLFERSLVLVAINDKQDSADGDAGNHWSLLAVDMTKAEAPRFIHHDSLGGFNSDVANNLADKVRLNVPELANAQFLDAPIPNQSDSYNCGVYALATAEAICEWYLANHDELSTFDWVDLVVERCTDPQAVHAMRDKYINMVEPYDNNKKM